MAKTTCLSKMPCCRPLITSIWLRICLSFLGVLGKWRIRFEEFSCSKQLSKPTGPGIVKQFTLVSLYQGPNKLVSLYLGFPISFFCHSDFCNPEGRVTDCSLMSVLSVLAEYDQRWKTSILKSSSVGSQPFTPLQMNMNPKVPSLLRNLL